DIRIEPLANLIPAAEDSVCYGILTSATHVELERLYAHARDVLGGTYLPEPVMVHIRDGAIVPALCYIATGMQPRPGAYDCIDRIVAPAISLGFPSSYIAKLESFRPR